MQNVSIIVTCEEAQQQKLRQLLPELTSMRYEGEHEVIVVDKEHDKDMAEWLEEVETRYPHLSHTFCPASAKGIDVHRLSLILGAKASAYEWLAILPADVVLPDGDWLERLMMCRNDETDVVIGITNRKFRLNWLTSYFCRRRFSLFRRTSFVILCRRDSLLQGKAIKSSNSIIVKL